MYSICINKVVDTLSLGRVLGFCCLSTSYERCITSFFGYSVRYLAKISVYDNNDQAVFMLFGDSGHELFGKKASELVESYFEANEDEGSDNLVLVPQALIDTIGRTRKFIVKVSTHNLTGKTQTLTVTKVLTPEDPDIEVNLEESDGERVKRAAENIEGEEPKRAKLAIRAAVFI
ncbi:hypothetical protein HID58_091705 [Brassica napus]|uniref:Replication factor A C-terminal domain-containing protein n=1 Tax=Brassica napus TaxID=3708 RepID=A0ABQ7WZ33_BRANA|nr:hypothetical protein HID58_091705 [Brassica napus]